jgi:ABC-type multidrug transport system fused ATPase/permease subunit
MYVKGCLLKQILSRIFKTLNRSEKKTFGSLIILNIIISILDIAFLGLLLFIVDFYTKNSGKLSVAFLPKALFDKNSILLICAFFVLFSIKNLLGFIIFRSQYNFIYDTASRISKSILLDHLKSDYVNHITTDSSVHIRKISPQPIEFSQYVLSGIQQIIAQSVLIFFTLVAIVIYKPFLFLLLFVLLLPPVIFIAFLIKKRLKAVRSGTKLSHQKSIQHLNEALAGYVESNIYNKSDFFINRYYRYQHEQNKHLADQQILQGLPSRLIEVFAILGFFILIVINKWATNNVSLDFITIGAFLAASYKIIPGIVKILNSSGQIKTYEFTLNDLADAKHFADTSNPTERDISTITFKKVSFGYKNRKVLNELSFDIQPGDIAGLSGDSGKGKTTVINLLLGFLTPDDGAVLINGVETRAADRKLFWKRISYIKQQSFLIHDTISKNITLSEDEPNQQKLNDALAISGFDTEINKYPDGLNHLITENGKNISGGQRQRLSIARAIYHDFDLLILDEPFSELDEASAISILKHLALLAQKGKTIIFITHHTSSLAYCNKIIRLDKLEYAKA